MDSNKLGLLATCLCHYCLMYPLFYLFFTVASSINCLLSTACLSIFLYDHFFLLVSKISEYRGLNILVIFKGVTHENVLSDWMYSKVAFGKLKTIAARCSNCRYSTVYMTKAYSQDIQYIRVHKMRTNAWKGQSWYLKFWVLIPAEDNGIPRNPPSLQGGCNAAWLCAQTLSAKHIWPIHWSASCAYITDA